MELPTKDAQASNRKPVDRNSSAKGTNERFMLDPKNLEAGAQAAIEKVDDQRARRDQARKQARPKPYVVTRPGGRTVITPKNEADDLHTTQMSMSSTRKKPRRKHRSKSKAIATYNPSHPSVLFHRLKDGMFEALGIATFGRRLTDWLHSAYTNRKTPRRELRQARGGGTRLIQHRSGLILPTDNPTFMLTETRDTMSDLLAENQRLRKLVDEIIRTDPVELAKLRNT